MTNCHLSLQQFPDKGEAGAFRRKCWPRGSHRGHPSRSCVAEILDPLRGKLDVGDAQEVQAAGLDVVAFDL